MFDFTVQKDEANRETWSVSPEQISLLRAGASGMIVRLVDGTEQAVLETIGDARIQAGLAGIQLPPVEE